MSKFMLACRQGKVDVNSAIEALSDRCLRAIRQLLPNEQRHRAVAGSSRAGVAYSCSASSARTFEHSSCYLLGGIGAGQRGWSIPGGSIPDGSYGLFRSNDYAVELVADELGTRSIWYFFDNQWFLASNSQRALVAFLGSFEPSAKPIPWMLANGVLGPDQGWDARLKRVCAGACVRLNRVTWQLTEQQAVKDFTPRELSDTQHRTQFREAVQESVDAIELDPERWILPLSGGYDSRLLACLLKDRKGLKTVTWGTSKCADDHSSEGAVARQLANALGIQHEYLPVRLGEDTLESVMDRFVRMSEGCTDSLTGYLDGFRMWSELSAAGVHGIIRGDEAFGGFGWSPVHSERDVRLGLGLALLSDLPSTSWLISALGMEQQFPASLGRLPVETLETWRVRLYHEYRVSVALAALNETKTAFVEIVNPLQFRRVVEVVRGLPDRLRRDKYLLIDLVKCISPDVPYATVREGDQLLAVLRQPDTIAFFKRELNSDAAFAVFSEQVLTGIVERLPATYSTPAAPTRSRGAKQDFQQWARGNMPMIVKRKLKRFIPAAPLDPCVLAFRSWIVTRIFKLLAEDAMAIGTEHR